MGIFPAGSGDSGHPVSAAPGGGLSEERGAEQGLSRPARIALTAAGLALLALAGLASYSDAFVAAAPGKILLRLPTMPADRYFFIPVWLVTLLLPAGLVLVGLLVRSSRSALLAPWRSARTAVPLAATLFLYALVTAFPWGGPDDILTETTALVLNLALAGSGLALLLAGAYRQLRFFDHPAERFDHWLTALNSRWFMLLIGGFAFVAANLISLLVFEHIPHIQDSVSQLFQGRIFASGHLYLASPRFPEFFDLVHVINSGRWLSQYPFFHSFLLMFGVFAGVPWLVNPLLGALTAPAVYLLGREVYGERVGRFAGVLAVLSPFILNMSAEYMNHASTLLLLTLFLLFFFRSLRTGRRLDMVMAGVMLGLAFDTRPYTAAAIALPAVVYLCLVRRTAAVRYWPLVAGFAAAAGLTLAYNWLAHGSPLRFGYDVEWGASHGIGFGRGGWGPGHTPLRGLVNTGSNMNGLARFLFEWPVPGLLPVAFLFASGTRDRRDWALFSCFAAVVAAHFFYWYQDLCFGPRFFYETSVCLILLTVRGAAALGPLTRRTFGLQLSDDAVRRFLGRTVPLLLLFAVGISLPPLYLQRYKGYYGVDSRLLARIRQAGLRNAVVLCENLSNAFNRNALDLKGDVVYAQSLDMFNPALTLSFPGRDFYYAGRDTLYRLDDLEYEGSGLQQTLDDLAVALADTVVAQLNYKAMLWPTMDLAPDPEDVPPGVRLFDYRTLSRRVVTGESRLEELLPALAFWVVDDPRISLRLFSGMNRLENTVFGNVRFTLLYTTADSSGAVYDIRYVTGKEVIFGR